MIAFEAVLDIIPVLRCLLHLLIAPFGIQIFLRLVAKFVLLAVRAQEFLAAPDFFGLWNGRRLVDVSQLRFVLARMKQLLEWLLHLQTFLL